MKILSTAFLISLRRRFPLICAAAILGVAASACGNDDDPSTDPDPKPATKTISMASVSFDTDNVWVDCNKPDNMIIGDFSFSHSLSEWDTVEGFTAACLSSALYEPPMYLHQYNVITCGGPEGVGSPYIVGFWSSRESSGIDGRSCAILRTDGQRFNPSYVKVTNTCYAYFTMLHGDDFCKKFEKGDWMKLVAHGVTNSETGLERTVEFYLANCTSSDASEGILNRWERFDLSPLGNVEAIYFTLESSDSGQWGMNTPSYFAIAEFTIFD